ncbi:thiamine-phosphate kinase [Silvimonas iriomotensis]|uniref:Thiamine-monophosphate kinase n=1 Tax=Silvimonas iriomotensis TaxID=449662 RepID=A0ABQ2P7A9_9NEIS|nr:thiamine-phosphate kinase [Silvimonas iriomotensis]GGP19750.1 thiamine-monophosphate kinase [Silvimonas iriomotensis]
MNEFDLIKRYFNPATQPAVADLGIGDDAALLTPRAGCQQAISVDMLVSGRHFFADVDPWRLGYKSLAVNLSDLAAMGAVPRWFTLALALPAADTAWLDAFSRGLFHLAQLHGVELVGGDTTRGPLTISIQIAGEVETGTALTRCGASDGDDVWVSGVLGAAAAAVAQRTDALQLAPEMLARCLDRLEMPTPRVALGRALRGLASACLDVSDGIVGDLGHICERSGLRAELFAESLPVDPVLGALPLATQQKLALAGGDEYELCFCAPATRREQILHLALEHDLPLTRVGRMLAPLAGAQAVQLVDGQGAALAFSHGAFDHFGA